MSQKVAIAKLETFIDIPNNVQNVFLLKGFAGTGKTFITKWLIEYLQMIGRTFVLAALTGKLIKLFPKRRFAILLPCTKQYTLYA